MIHGAALAQPIPTETSRRLHHAAADTDSTRSNRASRRARFGYGSGMGRILVGTASWTDKTLLESGWYPDDVTSAQERLAYYASRFPVVEVDSSYYAPPPESTVSLWRDR